MTLHSPSHSSESVSEVWENKRASVDFKTYLRVLLFGFIEREIDGEACKSEFSDLGLVSHMQNVEGFACQMLDPAHR